MNTMNDQKTLQLPVIIGTNGNSSAIELPYQWARELFPEAFLTEKPVFERRFVLSPYQTAQDCPHSVRGLSIGHIKGTKQPAHCYAPTIGYEIVGTRTLTNCAQKGYEIEGKISYKGKKTRAFTSSQLFEFVNYESPERDAQGNLKKILFDCAILYI